MSTIHLRNVTIAYQGSPVLRGVTADIEQGKLMGIVGPNGAGKSTLLKSMVGLIPLSTGSIAYGEQTIEGVRSTIAYVPQRSEIDWDFPVTVLDVVLMGTFRSLGYGKRVGQAQKQKAMKALKQMGMTAYADRQIGQLSGGQQQRVFLARALTQNPKIFMLDEPFVGVDAATEKIILDLLQQLKKEGKTVIVVNHDLSQVVKNYDEVMLINERLVAFGSPKKVMTPEYLDKTYRGRLTLLDQLVER